MKYSKTLRHCVGLTVLCCELAVWHSPEKMHCWLVAERMPAKSERKGTLSLQESIDSPLQPKHVLARYARYPFAMTVFLSRQSAWHFLQEPQFDSIESRRPSFSVPETHSKASSRELQRCFDMGASEPIHIVEKSRHSSRKGPSCLRHSTKINFPAGSFWALAKGIYVSSPELLFVEMASELPMVDLIRLGFRLCGSYAQDPLSPFGIRKRAPLTTVETIEQSIEQYQGYSGIKKARIAIKYVKNNSASPRETALVMLLCLPQRYGGYGLPFPELNGEIGVDRAKVEGYDTPRRGDLFWREFSYDLEYDSNAAHSGTEDLARDSARRAVLALSDITVDSITAAQMNDVAQFDAMARLISKRIGWRLRRTEGEDFFSRRAALRRTLLGHKNA